MTWDREHVVEAPITAGAVRGDYADDALSVSWEVADLRVSDAWECSCGELFESEAEAARHLQEVDQA